ncbi:MAG TPA: helix-turn-helix transcriptional regulator [Aridibacter sp.]|nr:helix-turn-helix transcriptional regulator [Aridibacter sp.]
MSKSLGEEIRTARRARGLTLVELSRLVNLSQPYLSQIERGKGNPSKRTIIALAQALGTNFGDESLNEYLEGEDPPPPTKKEIIDETSVEEIVTLKFGGGEDRKSKEEMLALARMLDKAIAEHDRIMKLPVRKSPKEKERE